MSDNSPTDETCWTRKTPFQAGLLLTLCVSVPFFLVMLFIYIASGTVWSESESCRRFCGVLLEWKSTATSQISPTTISESSSEPETTIPPNQPETQRRGKDQPAVSQRRTEDEPKSNTLPVQIAVFQKRTEAEPKTTIPPEQETVSKRRTEDEPETTTQPEQPAVTQRRTEEEPETTTLSDQGAVSQRRTEDEPETTTPPESAVSQRKTDESQATAPPDQTAASQKRTEAEPKSTTLPDQEAVSQKRTEAEPETTTLSDQPAVSQRRTEDEPETTTLSDQPEVSQRRTEDEPETTTPQDQAVVSQRKTDELEATTPPDQTAASQKRIGDEAETTTPLLLLPPDQEAVSQKITEAETETTAPPIVSQKSEVEKEGFIRHVSVPTLGQKNESFISSNETFEQCSLFPCVAALLENLYSDEETEQILKCSVVLLSSKWVLTIDECLENDLESVSVRINSNYWSKGGTVRKIQNLIRFMGLSILRVDDAKEDNCFIPVQFSSENEFKARRLFWNGDITRPLNKKSKFEKIQEVEVDLNNKVNSEEKGSDHIGAPLFNENQKLIGFQLYSYGEKVAYRSVQNYLLELIKISI